LEIFPFYRAEDEDEQKKQQEQLLQQQHQQQKQVKQPLPIKQEKPIDPAIEAEMKAKQERDRIPFEQRLKEFRQLLEEVSATNIWEKELSKVCNCTCTINIYISLK
jgi:maltooligosyltrehalose synthase